MNKKFIERVLRKAASVAIVTVVFGWFYGWAGPKAFPKDSIPGFKFGALHGALMPLALPALITGHDVPIYAVVNTGRNYKLGYICGINICGLIFFGSAFWRPTSTKSDKSQ